MNPMLTRRAAVLAAAAATLTSYAHAQSNERIIVTGASGQLGTLAVKALLARGVPAATLILVSRTPDGLAAFAKEGTVVRAGDFSKPETLKSAFAGGTKMLLISVGGGAGDRPTLHKAAIDAAVAAGVKHIAYTGFIGVSKGDVTGLGADHHKTEEILKSSGVKWTMLRNSIYSNTQINAAAKMIAEGRATVRPDSDRIGYVSREDCAAVAAAVLTTPGHENKAYDITGPEIVGPREVAAAASAVTGKKIEVVDAPVDPNARPRRYTLESVAVVSTAVKDITGKAPMSVRDVLAANKDKLLAGPT